MLVILSRDHAGKPGRPTEPGAAYDLDGDGVREVWEYESQLTPYYGLACERALIEAGHDVMWICDGYYPDRHRRANAYAQQTSARVVYLALHLNAGGGDYGSAFYDHRSGTSNGPALAQRIAWALERACPELDRALARRSTPGDWTRRAWATVGNLAKPVGICLEPCFVDNPAHAPLLTRDGLERIGYAVAAGIIDWHDHAG